MAKLKKVSSLYELWSLAQTDERYKKLLICTAENLGCVVDGDMAKAYMHLLMEWLGSDEWCIIAEVNFCRDLV